MQNTIEVGTGGNTTTTTSSHSEPQHTPVNRVNMKPPSFYSTNSTICFRQSQSGFILAGSNNNTTKYFHIIRNNHRRSTCPWKLKSTVDSRTASTKSPRSQKRTSLKKLREHFHWMHNSFQLAFCASSASFRIVI